MYDDVYHMMSCDAYDVVTVDFEFVNKEGFGDPAAAVPTVQVRIAFLLAVIGQSMNRQSLA